MTSVKNAPRTITKGVHHSLGLGTLQAHDGRCTMRFPRLLKDLDACFGTVLKLLTDQCNVRFVRPQLADNLLGTARQGFHGETFSAMRERILQQLARHVVRRDNEDRDAIFGPSKRLGHSTASNTVNKTCSGDAEPNLCRCPSSGSAKSTCKNVPNNNGLMNH